MNWKVLAGKKETFRGSPVSELRFPTSAEIRYWCFSGAAQGVRGMFWWSYTRSIQARHDWIAGEFADATREFRQFVDLTAPAHTPTILSEARDAGFLVNGSPQAQPLTCSLQDEMTEATLVPWGSTRVTETSVHEGRLTGGSAHPWEVFVWKVVDAI